MKQYPAEYLTPTGRPKKRWVTVSVEGQRKPERWLIETYSLDQLKKLIPAETDAEATIITITAVVKGITLDAAKAEVYRDAARYERKRRKGKRGR